MGSQVSLSVIIPVYNGEAFLKSTIDSVLDYSVGLNVECVVIDDGSTDGTPEIIRSYGEKIRWFNQSNAGESSAVNLGLAEAVGQYVVVISADDPVFTRELFLNVEDFFKKNSSAVAWYPNWRVIDNSGKVLKLHKLPEYSFRDLFAKNRVLPGPGTWFRREAALKIHGRRIKWKYVGDYDFWLRLSLCGELVNRKEVVAQWRKHSNSTSIAARGAAMARERIEVIEDFIQESQDSIPTEMISLARATSLYLAAKLGFFSREVNSRELFIASLKTNVVVLKSAKFHECIFMLLFPLSKVLVDYFLQLRRTHG